jgi:hypothetical protein
MEDMSSPVCFYGASLTPADFRAGATLPHGMVKVGLDTDSPGNVRLSSVESSQCLKFLTSNSKRVMMPMQHSMLLAFRSCMIQGLVVCVS